MIFRLYCCISLGASVIEEQSIPFTEIQVNQLPSGNDISSVQHGGLYSMVH